MTFAACVALSVRGEVLSKGYGFSLPQETHYLPSAALVHPLQVLEALQSDAPPVNCYATPQTVWDQAANRATP